MPLLFRSALNRKHEEQRALETMNRSRGDRDLAISSAIIKAVYRMPVGSVSKTPEGY